MMKFFKIIAIVFCFALTAIVFKDGIPTYSHSSNYAGFMAALVLFITGVLLLISLIYGKGKPVMSYRQFIKKMKTRNDTNKLETIEEQIKLLKESYNDGILNKNEFSEKLESLESSKNAILNKTESEIEFTHKKKQLLALYENRIITKDELTGKINELRTELQIDASYCADPVINDDTKIYFVSDCKQHGPLPLSYVVYLLKTRQISPNCFYKLSDENSYSHRVRELSQFLSY